MSLTTMIDVWANLKPLHRFGYSLLIGILMYIAFRYFIYKLNKTFANEISNTKKRKGNYWERIKQNAMANSN
jgi:hypothetical protein